MLNTLCFITSFLLSFRRIDDGKISGPEENSYSQSSVGGSDAAPPDDSSNGSGLCNGSGGELSNTTKMRKRRRRNNQDNDTLDVSYFSLSCSIFFLHALFDLLKRSLLCWLLVRTKNAFFNVNSV